MVYAVEALLENIVKYKNYFSLFQAKFLIRFFYSFTNKKEPDKTTSDKFIESLNCLNRFSFDLKFLA
jgi:hypothetical protein